MQCVSLLVGSVGGRFKTHWTATLQVKTNELLWSVLVFFFLILAWCGIPACFRLIYIVGKNENADCWFPWRNVDAACRLLLQKKKNSKSSDKTSSTTGCSAAMFLVCSCWHDMYPDLGPLASETLTCDQAFKYREGGYDCRLPILAIKWYGSIYVVSLVEKKVQFHLSRKNYRKFHSNGKHSWIGPAGLCSKNGVFAFGRHPWNSGIMFKIMLNWRYYAQIMPD